MTKVFTNGCFDIIHPGHLSMLKHCAAIGEHVLVGIDSDARVREMKGNNRPINDQEARRLMLMNIKWVNEVKIFNTDEELSQLVEEYQPDYMIVGADWKEKKVIGSEHAKIVGFFEKLNEHSTTNIIKRIANR